MMTTMTMIMIISHNFKTTKQEGQSEIENLNDSILTILCPETTYMQNIPRNFCEFAVFI
jgi:hypothetical protein